MEIKGLDNKIYKWNPLLQKRDFLSSSSYHEIAKTLLKKMYPFDIILEEVDLPGTKTKANGILRADFFIPKLKKLIEVHGEQHYSFMPFFHSDASTYALHKLRDENKKQWCLLNNIEYIELPYNEGVEEWEKRIQN